MREPRRILIVKLSSIGDVVQSLPVAAALRRRFPESYIAWAVGPAVAEVLTGNPALSDVLVVGGSATTSPGSRSLPPLSEPIALRRELHAIGFDLALDLQGLFKSAAVAYLSGARDRIGFRTLREGTFLLNNRRILPDRRDVHAVDSYLDFAEALGAPRQPVEFAISISGTDREVVDRLLGSQGDFAALIPGARWESKLWPTDRFAAAAQALTQEFSLVPVIVGAPGDAGLAREIAAASRTPVIDLTGKTTLKQLAEVFLRCRVTIGNDTGPLYISAAMGTPTVAIFGPTDSRRLGPYGDGHAKVIADIECAPCRNRRCPQRRCMEMIEPARVVAAARELLSRSPLLPCSRQVEA
jgi:heptosyltransferase-1